MRGVKIYILLLTFYLVSLAAHGQYVQSMGYKDYSFWLQANIGGQGAHTTDAAAYLELGKSSGSTKGFLLPRGSKASVTSPATGLMFYDLATNMPYYYNGSIWVAWGGDTATGASAALGYGLHYANDAIAVDTSLIGYKTWITSYVTNAIDASNLDPYSAGFGLLLDDVLNKFSVDSSIMATRAWTTNEITNALAGFTVSFPNYSDTLQAYMKRSDTITLSNRIDAIADGTGLNLSFNNGLEKIMDEVHATYWNPMWNANRIQGFYVDATTPGNGYFLGFDSTAGIVRWMRPDSVLGSGVDLSDYYTKSESDARYLQTESDVVALAALIDTANQIRADMAGLGGGSFSLTNGNGTTVSSSGTGVDIGGPIAGYFQIGDNFSADTQPFIWGDLGSDYSTISTGSHYNDGANNKGYSQTEYYSDNSTPDGEYNYAETKTLLQTPTAGPEIASIKTEVVNNGSGDFDTKISFLQQNTSTGFGLITMSLPMVKNIVFAPPTQIWMPITVNGHYAGTDGNVEAYVSFTPSSSTDNAFPNGTLAVDDTNMYYRTSTGTWVKIAWTTF